MVQVITEPIIETQNGCVRGCYTAAGNRSYKNEWTSRFRLYFAENHTIIRSGSSPDQPVLSINNLSHLC